MIFQSSLSRLAATYAQQLTQYGTRLGSSHAALWDYRKPHHPMKKSLEELAMASAVKPQEALMKVETWYRLAAACGIYHI